MSLLQEATFARLLPRYERVFGGPPPFRSATLDEVVEHMRHRLRAVEATGPEVIEFAADRAGVTRTGISQPESGSRPVH